MVMLQETYLDGSISSSETFPPHFVLHHKERNLNGGGVCIAINSSFNCVDLTACIGHKNESWNSVSENQFAEQAVGVSVDHQVCPPAM